MADINEAMRLKPNFQYAIAARGSLRLAAGAKDEAIADLSEAIRLNPKDLGATLSEGVHGVSRRDLTRPSQISRRPSGSARRIRTRILPGAVPGPPKVRRTRRTLTSNRRNVLTIRWSCAILGTGRSTAGRFRRTECHAVLRQRPGLRRIFGVISTQKSGGCSKAAEPETP